MTDGAKRTFSIRKLLHVTTRAWHVIGSARTFGNRGVRILAMTQQARKARMICRAVLKLRIVEALGKLHLLLGGLWFVSQSRPVNAQIDQSNSENDNGDRERKQSRRDKIFVEPGANFYL